MAPKKVRHLWKSRHLNLTVPVRKKMYDYNKVTGERWVTKPAIRVCFGVPGDVVQITNPLTGELDVMETFRGGVYDLDVMAADMEWDEEIVKMIERRLDTLALERPGMLERVQYAVMPAEKPWPTFDQMADIQTIAERASELGLIGKALAYERENMERADLIRMLEAAQGLTPDPEPDPAPVVALEPQKQGEEPLKALAVF